MADGQCFFTNRATESIFVGHIHKSGCNRLNMDSMLKAAILFWIPLLVIGFGVWLTISRKSKKFGIILSALAILLFLASPWTVPESDSTAGAHLILSLIAPTLLMVYGIHGMIFGGNVPVGRLDASARWSGFLALFASFGILCFMHWSTFTPVWRGDVNPYWIVFWPTMLLFSTSLCAAASIGMVGYGEDRFSESLKLASMSIVFAGITLSAMIFDGEYTSAQEFRDYLFLAVADILGIIAGCVLSIGVFAIVIWSYEKSLPNPENTHPPTTEELKKLVEIADSHIGGEEE